MKNLLCLAFAIIAYTLVSCNGNDDEQLENKDTQPIDNDIIVQDSIQHDSSQEDIETTEPTYDEENNEIEHDENTNIPETEQPDPDPLPEPLCGDGTVNGDDVCDNNTINCIDIDSAKYSAGSAACRDDCSGFDESSCVEKDLCGNNELDGNEICDGTPILCTTLDSEAFSSGTAGCKNDCSGYNTKNCTYKTGTRLYPVKQNGRWGYIDNTGKVIINPASKPFNGSIATSFKDGIAVVSDKNFNYWFIDKNGNNFFGNRLFYNAHNFSEGYAAVATAYNEWFFINRNGDTAFDDAKFALANPFSGGYSAVQYSWGDDYAFMDLQGKDICGSASLIYTYADTLSFSDGFAAINGGNGWYFINTTGNRAFEGNFYRVRNFSEGYAVIIKEGSLGGQTYYKSYFIDKNGNKAFNGKEWDGAYSFSQGYAAVMKDGKWGVINTTGEYVLNPDDFNFTDIGLYSEGYFAAATGKDENKKWGYIDISGTFIVQPEYNESAEPFRAGVARVKNLVDKQYLYGYVNNQGLEIWPPQN